MNLIDRDKLLKTIPSEEMVARMAVMSAPTVGAVPVSYIQQRIDSLQSLADYQFDASGGYTGQAHTEIHALKSLIKDWRDQGDTNHDKTD